MRVRTMNERKIQSGEGFDKKSLPVKFALSLCFISGMFFLCFFIYLTATHGSIPDQPRGLVYAIHNHRQVIYVSRFENLIFCGTAVSFVAAFFLGFWILASNEMWRSNK